MLYTFKKYIVEILVLFLCPMISLFFILKRLYNEERGATYILALFIGVFAYCFPPAGDLFKLNFAYCLF